MAAPDLVTLTALKTYMGISTATEDTLLTQYIHNMSVWIQQYLSRDIWVQDYTEVRDGTGTDAIAVSDWPLVSITTVSVDGMTIPQSMLYNESGWVFFGNMIYLRGTYRFTRGRGNVYLAYKAGFATDDASVPKDIQQATMELIRARYDEQRRMGVSAKSIGGENISFFGKPLPASVDAMLNNYARRVPL